MTLILPPLLYRIHASRPDLRAAFDLNTVSGITGLAWWMMFHGFVELPVDGRHFTSLLPFAKAAAGGTFAGERPVTRLMREMWRRRAAVAEPGRPGWWSRLLGRTSRSRSEDSIASWYYRRGLAAHNLLWTLDPEEIRFLREDIGGVSRIERMIWMDEPDLRAGTRSPSDPAFRATLRRDYHETFAILSHPKIGICDNRVARSLGAVQARRRFGVNLYGHARARLGIGEDVRMAAKAFAAANVPFRIVTITAGDVMDEEVAPADSGADIDFAFNLFCMTGLETHRCIQSLGTAVTRRHYNIGYWPWELPDWPEMLSGCFESMNEIWSSSVFTADAMRKATKLPVEQLPMTVDVSESEGLGRSDFGLDENALLFGFALDGCSTFARKNPVALVRAFQVAFPDRADVGLIIKGLRVDEKEGWIELKSLAAKDQRVRLLSGSYSRGRLMDLYRALDVFVSLHRSEGYGRNIAEAMLLGKPVVATGYSGNLDFTQPDTAILIDSALTPVGEDEYFFADGSLWADPDPLLAAAAMRQLADDPGFRQGLGAKGRAFSERYFAADRVGAAYQKRLLAIIAQLDA